MKEIWQHLKSFFIVLGALITIILITFVFEYNPPEWTGNTIDDLLYYAYNNEKFGIVAYIWRGFIFYAVMTQTFKLLNFSWNKLKIWLNTSPNNLTTDTLTPSVATAGVATTGDIQNQTHNKAD
jgi:hypothetical protein